MARKKPKRTTRASLAGLGSPPKQHRHEAKARFNHAYSNAETAIYWAKNGYCHDALLSLVAAFQARGEGMEAARGGRLSRKKMRAEFKFSFEKVSEALDAVTKSPCLARLK